MTDDIPNEVRKVAATLARQDGKATDYGIEVIPGFKVPQWLLYVSAARKLLDEREALSAK